MSARASELERILRALVQDIVREEVERAMLGLRGPDPSIETYTSLRLPPDASRRLFREECARIPEAILKGRVWTVSKEAWEAHREKRRGEGRANIRAGRPATGMVVWDDPEAKTIPRSIRVTRLDGSRETTKVPEGTTAARAIEMARERAVAVRTPKSDQGS